MSNSYVTILDKLSKAVEKNAKYKVEDALNKNLLAEDARKYDKELLNLLQKDKDLKNHFFAETDGGLVFKKDVFLQFISNKEFLPDSYSRYANKIGLGSDDGSLLSGSKDVVLNWPYKDAVLEGGQDKEDQKRSEVFFNEVLAPDQITRLLDDKVFTNWKRYDKNGEHELDELKDDDNLIIKGNNLVVLHSLKKRYAGKVKLIYIDPPYNTGSDGFGYNDNFNHSTWLTFMRNRLSAARSLLAPNGVIFVQCDDNEQAYLKVLMDEVFGRKNYLRTVSMKKKQSAGVGQDAFVLDVVEYNLIYARDFTAFSEDKYYIDVPFDDKQMNNYSSYIASDVKKEKYREITDAKGNPVVIYKWVAEIKSLPKNERTMQSYISNFDKHFVTYNPQSSLAKKIIKEIDKTDYYEAVYKPIRGKNQGKETSVYFYKGRIVQRLEDIATISGKEIVKRQTVTNFWDDMSWDTIGAEGGVSFSNGKKPERLLQRIIEMTTKSGDTVLDYHVGSGTTAAVAHKMGRQYIGIEQLYYGDNDPTVRLQNVINGDQSGISKSVDWQGGGSFVYANIMNNANKFRKRVESAKDDKEYLALLEEATSSSFLSYRVDPTKLNENEFRKLSSSDKRRLLLELIDNNTLYVNYEDINDPSFKVSDTDKKFNKELYK